MIDHYQVLGIRRDASQLAIKRAYRKLAKRCHPDRNPGDARAEERFKEINAAYEVLGDLDERWQYDRKLLGLDRGTPADGIAREPGAASDRGWAPPSARPAPLPDFALVDGVLGGLLALSFALAAAERSAAPGIAAITLGALALAGLLSWGGDAVLPIEAGKRAWRRASLLACTAVGVVASGFLAPVALHALAMSSGWFFALMGGLASGVVGAGFGRIFRSAAGSVAGAVAAVVIGATLGLGLAGFLWYWSAVFRWTGRPWPPDESLSLIALAGVMGSALGGALAALVGTMRLPADRE